ncbi:patatin-like phospholipase family protein [Ferribacterium limneticum]|uniref:patatin-like phospholipase family protein n=1 Tax=Ferribacterium limneticum TaxID=76259 RepID=UPI001CFABD8E|nr:patatin-like phospholipase family protein [Ferribacterium limneticum]UCV17731.1 patatin-like phospholipase family protein [Ferribacterium limneticum]
MIWKPIGGNPERPPKIALVLGSGSARGLAHLGVIRAIEAAGIEVDFVVGTSMGALIGAIYAAGKLDDLETTFKTFDWKKTLAFFDVILPKSGLLDGAKVSELIRAHIHADSISALRKPFAALATDIVNGDEVVIRHGDVIEAVRASISVPGIFTPVRSNGRILVDGGLTNPVPVSVARAMGADIVIAVDLNHEIIAGKNFKPLRGLPNGANDETLGMFSRWVDGYRQSMQEVKSRLLALDAPGAAQFARWASSEEAMPNIFEVLLASINIMETRITQTRLELDQPDILIRPPLGDIRFLEFGRAEEIIEIGYRNAQETLARLPCQLPRR